MSTITRLRLSNFTAFDQFDHRFASGVTIITGANGTGKTHLLKLIYSACAITIGEGRQSTFSQKLINVFKPYENRIGRLARRKAGSVNASIIVEGAAGQSLSYKFSNHTKDFSVSRSASQNSWKQNSITAAYIPVKEMLAHAPGFVSTSYRRELSFEDVYADIIKLAYLPTLKGPQSSDRKSLLAKLQNTISGKVITKGESFFLKNGQGDLEFTLLAEGIRKLALIWLLIQNGTLLNGSVLLWDEPEANLNPALMEQLVEVILQLQRNGVQVIITTHNFTILRYFELKKKGQDSVEFLNLRRNDRQGVSVEASNNLFDLSELLIKKSLDKLYDDEIKSAIDLGL